MYVYIYVCVCTQLQYVSPDDEEFEQLKEQMLTQLEEGQGETIYEIGVGGVC